MSKVLVASISLLSILTVLIFFASCVIALSDAQGALIFVFTIPAMFVLQVLAIVLARKFKAEKPISFRIDFAPKILSCMLAGFFVCAFIPGLSAIPDAFMGLVGRSFSRVTGKTPRAYFEDRASFSRKLEDALKTETRIRFSDLHANFAWDRVCIFGPYTNNDMARQTIKLDWNIEERSQIHFSDSINALVFLYQGRVNHVVDLKRGIADFKKVDVCIGAEEANFEVEDLAGRKVLRVLH